MKKAFLHEEEKRLTALHSKKILEKQVDPRFDKLTKEAVKRLKMSVSTVSVIDKDKEIYIGSCGIEVKEGSRDTSFCGHALVSVNFLMICEDTFKDERFHDNPYVIGPPYVRFYAGQKLLDKETGLPLAVFCVKDTKPRELSSEELGIFLELANKAENLINSL